MNEIGYALTDYSGHVVSVHYTSQDVAEIHVPVIRPTEYGYWFGARVFHWTGRLDVLERRICTEERVH